MNFNFFKSMLQRMPYNCDDELGAHTCDPCTSDREYARVRSVALIAKSYLATLLATPTIAATWQTGIDDGSIIIIPDTRGSFDPGDPAQLPGYGDNKYKYGPREQKLDWFDPNFKDNYSFYNTLSNITQKVLAFKTSSQVHIADVTASIFGKDPVEDNLESEVVWNGNAIWLSTNLPSVHDASLLADIFACAVDA